MDTLTGIAIREGEATLSAVPTAVNQMQRLVDSSFAYTSLKTVERYVAFVEIGTVVFSMSGRCHPVFRLETRRHVNVIRVYELTLRAVRVVRRRRDGCVSACSYCVVDVGRMQARISSRQIQTEGVAPESLVF